MGSWHWLVKGSSWLLVSAAVSFFGWHSIRESGLVFRNLQVPPDRGVPTAHGAAPSAKENASLLPDRVTFDRYIRPILAQNCYTCHGPDEHYRKSGFRLDTEASLYAPLPGKLHKGWHAFVAGHPNKSLAYLRITSKDPSLKMPPPGSHLTINPYDAALVKKWIEQGAHWQPHWSYEKLVAPAVPAVGDSKWVKNDIDRFVLAKLRQHGLKPSPEADRGTLIRRVTMDLTGLPPTPAQVQAYENDKKPGAYERVVDRLLASPAYGEQMAVPWLDDARYADSYGFLNDPSHTMWLWRDWVIQAFNKDMPFDQFTIKQLAGDLLPHPTVNDLIATGFNRNNMINVEGGIIHEEWRVQGVIDRVATTGETWLGLTVACGQCHHHKYENISHRDFYSFYAFFNSVGEDGTGADGLSARSWIGKDVAPLLKVPSPAQSKQMALLQSESKKADAQLTALRKASASTVAAWIQSGAKVKMPAGLVARFPLLNNIAGYDADGKALPTKFIGQGMPFFRDGAFRGDGSSAGIEVNAPVGKFGRSDKFSISLWFARKSSGSLLGRMEAAPGYRGWDVWLDGGKVALHLIHQWPGNAIKVETVKELNLFQATNLLITYDGSSKAAGVKIYFNGKPQAVTILNDSLTKTIKNDAPFLLGRRINSGFYMGRLAHVHFYNRVLSPAEAMNLGKAAEIEAIAKLPVAKRTPAQTKELVTYILGENPKYVALAEHIAKVRAAITTLNSQIPQTQIMQDLPKPRPTYTLVRGQYDKHGRRVYPDTPHAFPPMATGEPKNRLGLADWIMQPNNPLTSRVLVNRLWAKYFGRGLCKTTDNVGVLGSYPTHVKLLDWLAVKMMALHWDLKKFQKMIVMSATYRQASSATPAMLALDPKNRLLERGPRFRLSAEEIRDQALAVSGLLVTTVGGPSVKPYEPLNLWNENVYGNLSKYTPDYGPGLYRRSLYTFVKRSAPPPDLTVFDMPDRQTCTIQRPRSDTPLQALVTLNDTQYVEAARVLAEQMMIHGGSQPAQRIAYACNRVMSRDPTPAELKILLAGYRQSLANYQANRKDAESLIHVGYTKPDAKLDSAELAAYTLTVGVIFNLDEALNCE